MSIDQGEDEAAAETAAGPDEHSIDRRSLLKKVGIAGAAAWVAPVVIESHGLARLRPPRSRPAPTACA